MRCSQFIKADFVKKEYEPAMKEDHDGGQGESNWESISVIVNRKAGLTSSDL
jgi:hypothetical protein